MTKTTFMLAVLALLMGGCATVYTSIDQNDDGSYTLTRQKQGFWTVGSNVYHCTEKGAGLDCTTINE